MTIGLCMIVRDEEQNLARCLSSVADVFDKIIIVDTGSTDRTKEIAKSFGAVIHDFTWIDDFAAARNFSFSKCDCDYIAWLDADDEVLPATKNAILQLKSHLTADVYALPYHYLSDEHGNPYVTLRLYRIIRNSPEVRWHWPIHECLQFPPHWVQQRIDDAPITHRRSGEDAVKDSGRNLRILKKAVAENHSEPRLKYYYAKELFSDGLLKESLVAFEDYYRTGGGWHDDQINGRFMVAMAHLKFDDEAAAIASCLEGIKQDPNWAEFYMLIGQIHYDKERWAQAASWFEIASRLPIPQSLGVIVIENYTWAPHDRLCKCYSQIGKIREAYDANEKALTFKPNEPRLLFNREFLRDVLFSGRTAERPVRLSLGSGGKPTPSYRCTDMYQAPNVEELIDQTTVPYKDATIHAIYSEHALEHAPGHSGAEKAIAEWARVMRHGGHVTIKVPDLEQCCLNFVRAEDRDAAQHERFGPRDWFKYTIYGIQDITGDPHPEGQYHRTGFTQQSLQRILESHGFEVQSNKKYDGWGTPSLEVTAVQMKQPLKIVWFIPGVPDESHGSLRIRRLNVHRWLQKNGVNSTILNPADPVDIQKAYNADICVFISFGAAEKTLIDQLKRRGIKCIFDHCEDMYDLPHQTECFQAVDVIACCSTVLTEKSTSYGRAIMVPDACEDLT